jgi:hypothetical protein
LSLTVAQLQCITENLPAIGCTLLDVECQCSSKNSTKILQPCLEKQCSYHETFGMFIAVIGRSSANVFAATLRAQASLCDRPHDNLSNSIRIVAYVSGIIPIIVIAMRFASRSVGGNKLWWDDWLHLASVVSVRWTSRFHLTYGRADFGHPYDCGPDVEPQSGTRPSYMGPDISTCRGNREMEYAFICQLYYERTDYRQPILLPSFGVSNCSL